MVPKFIIEEIDQWIGDKRYGDLKIVFQNGQIMRWVRMTSQLPPNKSSGTYENPGSQTTQTIDAPQGTKLEE